MQDLFLISILTVEVGAQFDGGTAVDQEPDDEIIEEQDDLTKCPKCPKLSEIVGGEVNWVNESLEIMNETQPVAGAHDGSLNNPILARTTSTILAVASDVVNEGID